LRFASLLPPAACVVEATPPMWESGLLPEERGYVARALDKRVREFTAGRNCARAALRLAGTAPVAIAVGPRRQPLFPPGYSGSITHTDGYCAAAVLRIGAELSIGIDAEGCAPLPAGVLQRISLPAERAMLERLDAALCGSADRLLFSIKEAFYKAWFQLSAEFLAFRELQVTIDPSTASFGAVVLRPEVADYFRDRQFSGRFCLDAELICSAVALPRA
jgi:4'-phosphopantetheinyl transferase EntD